MTALGKDWLIIGVNSRETLLFPNRLAWMGIEAYSPSRRYVERVGENRTRRQKREALSPGYVFVAGGHTRQMLELHRAQTSPEYRFWFPQSFGGLSYCPDSHLRNFRLTEMMGREPEEVRKWAPGDKVRSPTHGLQGLVGTVVRATKKAVFVDFGLPSLVETSALLLLADEEQRMAA